VQAVNRRGLEFPVELTVTAHGLRNAYQFTAFIRDITLRKKDEEALQEASQRKDEFLANMSHELRTPMNVVIGLANILGMTSPLTPKQKEFIDTLKLSADNLLTLINDLLDFARLEQDAVELEAIRFNLREVIDNFYSLMNIRAREKNLELQLDYSFGLEHQYVGDPLRISQILTNVVSNALKFTKKGWVSIEVEGEEDPRSPSATLLTIRVTDTGIGIAADKRSTIFEKFSQADTSITRKYGGSGLGLAISAALAKKMGGSISVESEIGVGSVFIIRFPLKKASGAPPDTQAETPIAPATPLPKGNILLVEDYEANAFVASNMLEQLGYECDVATSGAEALDKFQKDSYDAVLMDIQMPEMDGLEVTRRIRKFEMEKNWPPTPIIAMTAHVMKSSQEACIIAGMDDFISKPFDPMDLVQKLTRALKH